MLGKYKVINNYLFYFITFKINFCYGGESMGGKEGHLFPININLLVKK